MADISAELQAIMDAVYGEEVRGSIHDAIEKINDVNEEAAGGFISAAQEMREAMSTFAQENVERVILWTRPANDYDAFARNKLDITLSDSVLNYEWLEFYCDTKYVDSPSVHRIWVDPSTTFDFDSDYPNFDISEIGGRQTGQTSFNMNYYRMDVLFMDPHTVRTRANDRLEFNSGSETLYHAIRGDGTGDWVDGCRVMKIVGVRSLENPNPIPIAIGSGEDSVILNDIENNVASGDYSHAEGDNTIASGYASHAEGANTTASGNYSHAEGQNTEASGNYSHAEGWGTKASGHYSRVSGVYNVEDDTHTQYLEIIGNGTGDSSRSNARTLDWEGNEWIAGDLELGPDRTPLTVNKIKAIEDFGELMQSLRTAVTVEGPTVTITDGAANMPLHEMIVDLLYSQDAETGEITPVTELTITANENTYSVNFEDIEGGVYKGTFYPLTGILSIEMIENSMTWGEMQFSIDPDNYLGKRIPLPNCLFGEDGNSTNTICNVSDTYIYDQSAATHYYVYKDEEEEGYAVVVLPDDTPDETVIQVAGTLIEPVEYQLTPIDIRTIAGNNTFSVDGGSIRSLTYYKDKIHDDIENLGELIEELGGLVELIDEYGIDGLRIAMKPHRVAVKTGSITIAARGTRSLTVSPDQGWEDVSPEGFSISGTGASVCTVLGYYKNGTGAAVNVKNNSDSEVNVNVTFYFRYC